MFGIINPLSYLIGTIILIIMPGPNSMFCLSVAAQHGTRKASRAVCGVLLGDLVLTLLTVLGAGTVLKLYPALFHAMKLAGGLYLAYIGFGPFEISWTIIAPMAVMYGFTGAFGAVSLAISIGVYLTFKFMGLLPPRGTIFKEGIGHVGQKQET